MNRSEPDEAALPITVAHGGSKDVSSGNTQEKQTDAALLEQGADQPSDPSKPLSFHLAFVALSLAVFVFQLDATALSNSLPV